MAWLILMLCGVIQDGSKIQWLGGSGDEPAQVVAVQPKQEFLDYSVARDKWLKNKNQPLIVIITGPSCAPCMTLKNEVKELLDAGKLAGALVCVVDSSKDPATAQRFGVKTIPTIYVYTQTSWKQPGTNLAAWVGLDQARTVVYSVVAHLEKLGG